MCHRFLVIPQLFSIVQEFGWFLGVLAAFLLALIFPFQARLVEVDDQLRMAAVDLRCFNEFAFFFVGELHQQIQLICRMGNKWWKFSFLSSNFEGRPSVLQLTFDLQGSGDQLRLTIDWNWNVRFHRNLLS
jgi:hypothetical protein